MSMSLEHLQAGICLASAALALVCLVIVRVMNRRCRAQHPRCGKCGYSLEGLASDKCSECGSWLTSDVLVRPGDLSKKWSLVYLIVWGVMIIAAALAIMLVGVLFTPLGGGRS
ncbi:MAG TPA: hypothetical protein VG711_12265 [Phycisphaerales bacterium]|nr:hypothetical protein [Phycisphaerales bacterium]